MSVRDNKNMMSVTDNKNTKLPNSEVNVTPNLADNQNSTPPSKSKLQSYEEPQNIKKLREYVTKAKKSEDNSKKDTNPLWEQAARFASLGAKFNLLIGQIIEYTVNLFNNDNNSKENKSSGEAAREEILRAQENGKKIKEDASNNKVGGCEDSKDILALEKDKNSLEENTEDAKKISASTDENSDIVKTSVESSNLGNTDVERGYSLEGIVTKKDENSLGENTGNEEVTKSYELSNLENIKVEISQGLEGATEVEGTLEDKGEVLFPAEQNSAADVAEVLPELKNTAGYSNVNLMSVNNTNHPLESLEVTKENKQTILKENQNDNQNDNNTSNSI